MNKAITAVFLFLSIVTLSQVGPRAWQDHLSINSCNSVAKRGSTIFASYVNGLIYFDERELSPVTLNKANGLSDNGIRLLRTNPHNNKVLVVYDNCNIDVIDANNRLRNYPDFKLKILNGKKIVNEVSFSGRFAYLACGFGIVVFDTEKHEVLDTYIIGPNARELEVFRVAVNGDIIYAATTEGIYQANMKTSNLSNFNSWKKSPRVPSGPTDVTVANGKVIGLYCPSRLEPTKHGTDSVYYFDDQKGDFLMFAPFATQPRTFHRFGPSFGEYFTVVDPLGLIIYAAQSGTFYFPLITFNGETEYGGFQDAAVGKDHTGNMSYWMGYRKFGLFQTYGAYPSFGQNKVTRQGMNRPLIANIDINQGRVAVSPSLINNAGTGNYLTEGLNIYSDNDWKYFQCVAPDGTPVQDVTSVLFDRRDPKKMWAASWSYGILEYENEKLIAVYNTSTHPMPQMIGTLDPRCSGLSQDRDGNIWFAHSDMSRYLGVIKKNKAYQNFDFQTGAFTRKTYVDRNNNVWMLHERDGGITVFKHNNFSVPTATVNFKRLNNGIGTGNLQSNSVYAIAEDQDGRMWIGTSAGISVLYNPSAIFGGGDYDAQPIKIVQDGNVELLLGNETVTSIVVDGANNKWVGTLQGGVYCFSPDGINQLFHFTKENSPLYSNSVVDINYDERTGDLYFGTEGGLQSYRGIIVKGEEQYSNVYAYPNPVKPNYQGSVLVRGLVDESIVKIADESGNLVWETKSAGGQIEWPVKTLSGARVASGVYIVYASTADGELRTLTKVLVVN